MKTLEILIIVVVLFLLAFVVGCKDEPIEPYDPKGLDDTAAIIVMTCDPNGVNMGIDIEPNEPEIAIDVPEYSWKCSCGMGFDEMFRVFCDCGKTYKTFDIVMKCIPTWPDYIELERDLWFDSHLIIEKGTKIYFK